MLWRQFTLQSSRNRNPSKAKALKSRVMILIKALITLSFLNQWSPLAFKLLISATPLKSSIKWFVSPPNSSNHSLILLLLLLTIMLKSYIYFFKKNWIEARLEACWRGDTGRLWWEREGSGVQEVCSMQSVSGFYF